LGTRQRKKEVRREHGGDYRVNSDKRPMSNCTLASKDTVEGTGCGLTTSGRVALDIRVSAETRGLKNNWPGLILNLKREQTQI